MAKMNDTRTVTCWNMVALYRRGSPDICSEGCSGGNGRLSLFRRTVEFARWYNLFGERFKTRIAAQRIEKRIHSNPAYVIPGAILIGLFKPTESRFFVAKSEIGKSKAIGCDVPLFGYLL